MQILDAVECKMMCKLFFLTFTSTTISTSRAFPVELRMFPLIVGRSEKLLKIPSMDADPNRVYYPDPEVLNIGLYISKEHFGVFDCTTFEKTLTDKYEC